MMGGQGSGYGMGPGMMDGYASRADLNLTAEQRSKIAKIRNDVVRSTGTRWARCRMSKRR